MLTEKHEPMKMRTYTHNQTIRRGLPGLVCGCILLAGACNNEDHLPSDTPLDRQIRFRTADIIPLQTRVSGNNWDDKDRIGIFMKRSGEELNAGNIIENADNRAYEAFADGSLTAVDKPLYYPLSGEQVDFLAYHPYRSEMTDYTFTADFGTQQNTPQEIDLLYSDNATQQDAGHPDVALTFEHQFSKLTLKIIRGVGVADLDLSGIIVTLKGTPSRIAFDLGSGEISELASGDIVPRTVTPGELYEAIIAPGSGAARRVEFSLNGELYAWAVPEGETWSAGKNHRYNVTINKISTISIEVTQAGIDDWTQNGPAEETTISEVRGIGFVTIPAGEFMMGSPEGVGKENERPQHKVTLTKSFRMSKYLITNAQFAEFMNARGIGENAKYTDGLYPDQVLVKSGSWVGVRWKDGKWEPEQTTVSQWPVINVSWYGAVEFARWIGGRLPTEAEWEYACRAGTTTKFYTGDEINVDEIQAILSGIKAPGSNENKQYIVGSCPPNPWGLYDMIGSVEEWTSDFYYTYTADDAVDPTHPAGETAVVRGAAWWHSAADAGSAFRRDKAPNTLSDSQGFRVVLPE